MTDESSSSTVADNTLLKLVANAKAAFVVVNDKSSTPRNNDVLVAQKAALAALARHYTKLSGAVVAASATSGDVHCEVIEFALHWYLWRADNTVPVCGALLRILELDAFAIALDDATSPLRTTLRTALFRYVRERIVVRDVASWNEWQALLRWRAGCAKIDDGDTVRAIVFELGNRLASAVRGVRVAFDANRNADAARQLLVGELMLLLMAFPRFSDDSLFVARLLIDAEPQLALTAHMRSIVRATDVAFSRAMARAAAQVLVNLLLAAAPTDADGVAAVWNEVDCAVAAAAARDDGAAHMALVRAVAVVRPDIVVGSLDVLLGPRMLSGVLHHCNTSRDNAVRVLAFVALVELTELVGRHLPPAAPLFKDTDELLERFVLPIEQTLLLCYDTALDTFAQHLRHCMTVLLPVGSEAWLHGLVARLARADYRRRSTLGVLSVCMQLRDVAATLIGANRHVVREALGALNQANGEMVVFNFLNDLLAQRAKLGDEFWLEPCVDWLLEHGSAARASGGDLQRQHLRVVEGALRTDAANVVPLLLNALWRRQRRANGLPRLSGVDPRVFDPLVALLHATRKLALVPGSFFDQLFASAVTGDGEPAPLTPLGVLAVALAHYSAAVRQVGFEALAMSTKVTDVVTPAEIELMRRATVLTVKGDIGTSRQMLMTCLASFLHRYDRTVTLPLRDAVSASAVRKRAADADALAVARAAVRDMVAFVNELAHALVASIYPGAVYQRVETALEFLAALLRQFPPTHRDAGVYWRHSNSAVTTATADLPVLELFTPTIGTLLLGKMLDLYDSTRNKAGEVLALMPTPLPGLESRELLQRLVDWAMRLLGSLRNSEGQMGAQALTLLLARSRATWPHLVLVRGQRAVDNGRPLVCESLADVQSTLGAAEFEPAHSHEDARLHVCRQLLALLRQQCDVARQQGLEYAAQHAPMHGVLLAIRAVLVEIDVAAVIASASPQLRAEWRQFVGDTCALVSQTLLGIVLEPLMLQHDGAVDDAAAGTAADNDGGGDDDDAALFDDDPLRLVSTLCWITVKESARCLSTLLELAPLDDPATRLLSPTEVRAIGAAQVRIMLQCQHKGGMERSYVSFVALCVRTLTSETPELFALPIGWLRGVLQFVRKPNRALYHTRRSAGLPYIVCGILAAERQTLGKNTSNLLPPTVRALLAAASGVAADNDSDELPAVASELDSSSDVTSLLQPNVVAADVDYGAVHVTQVHAMNVLRALLRERTLGESMTPLSAAAFEIVLDAFVSPVWGVRNSATMLFATLVDRTIGGGLNARDMARMSFTVFFNRFSSVLPHVFSVLRAAHQAPLAAPDTAEQSRVFATLVLLAKLAPSVIETSADGERLVPLVLAFANHRHLLVRRVAARALAPLVSRARLPGVLAHIAALLPADASTPFRHNVVHGLLLHVQMLLKCHAYSALVNAGFRAVGGGTQSRAAVEEEDNDALHDVQHVVLPQLLTRIGWLVDASRERFCPPIASVYFKLVHMYVQRTTHSAPQERGDFVDVALRLLRASAPLDRLPHADECLRRATKVALYDALVTAPSAERSESILILCATHRFVEVRRTTYDCALRLASAWPSALSRASLCQAALRETMAFAAWIDSDGGGTADVSHTAPLAAVRALPFLLVDSGALPDGVTLPQLWAALCAMACGGKRRFGAAVEPALSVLGAVAAAGERVAALAQLDVWIDLVDRGSRESSDLSLRFSALESLASCRGVWTNAALPREARARLWIAASRLLEDDDAEIRARCGELVFATLPIVPREAASGRLLAVPAAVLRYVMDEFADTVAVRALTVRLLCCGAADDALARLSDAQLLAAVEASGAGAAAPGVVVPACFAEAWSETRAYFDIEPANTHIEPLVPMETAVEHVRATQRWPVAREALSAVLSAQLAAIKQWLSDARAKRSRSPRGDWLLYETVFHCQVRRVLLVADALGLGENVREFVQWLEQESGQFVPPTLNDLTTRLSA
jgi:hypothetical protein